jgi:hypothetical protein
MWEATGELSGLTVQVKWQDAEGEWQTVDNWLGLLDHSGGINWLVWPKDFHTGPFRWVVYNRDSSVRFESDPFYLPGGGEKLLIEIGDDAGRGR